MASDKFLGMDVEPVIDRAKMRQRVLRAEQAIDIPFVARSIIRKLSSSSGINFMFFFTVSIYSLHA